MAENQDDTLRALIYKRGSPLLVLDQVKLPHEHKYIAVKTCEDGWNVINRMNVRGAPAIGLTGILSLSVQLMLDWAALGFNTKEDLNKFVHEKMDYLVTSRPTGVNLKIEADSVKALSTKLTGDTKENLLEMRDIILSHCEEAFYNDIKNNQDMGKFGSAHILSNKFSPPLRAKRSHAMRTEEGELPKNRKVSILTHCNTGSLATAGYGTALGVIRSLHSMGNLSMAYCTETRPYNQGSRLTAYELIYEKMPATLICDSAASALMATKEISAVIVGADRIAANGDTANKIGTLQLAIAAAHFGVPFYVAAPTSTIDLKTPTGKEIIIENRPDDEITLCKCHAKGRIPPEGIDCWNPSFDVTGAELITGGIVTEFGVIKPPVNTRQNLELLELDLSYSSLG